MNFDASILEQKQPRRIDLDLPRLRLAAENAPLLLRNICLQMVPVARLWRMMQAEIERHLMRRFAGLNQPARKDIFSGRVLLETEMM